MSEPIDPELLAERSASVRAHLDRVADHLPDDASDLTPMSSTTDTVILHLWQAAQIVIDLATSSCVRLGLGSPPTYGDAFRNLAEAGVLDVELADRLARAAAFRNLIVHADARLDLLRVHGIAAAAGEDLRGFLAALRDHASPVSGERPLRRDGASNAGLLRTEAGCQPPPSRWRASSKRAISSGSSSVTRARSS